jgi:hypothetical protein
MFEKNSLEMILFVGPSANVLFKKITFVFEHICFRILNYKHTRPAGIRLQQRDFIVPYHSY